MSKEMIKEAVAGYFAGIRDNDKDSWLSHFAPDAVAHDPVGAPPHEGHAGLSKFFDGMNKMFATVSLVEEDELFIAGNEAAVKWQGEIIGKNGRTVTFAGINTFAVNEEGKISLLKAYWSPGAMMKELNR
jgi:ketosteroid isomerase-like protein